MKFQFFSKRQAASTSAPEGFLALSVCKTAVKPASSSTLVIIGWAIMLTAQGSKVTVDDPNCPVTVRDTVLFEAKSN